MSKKVSHNATFFLSRFQSLFAFLAAGFKLLTFSLPLKIEQRNQSFRSLSPWQKNTVTVNLIIKGLAKSFAYVLFNFLNFFFGADRAAHTLLKNALLTNLYQKWVKEYFGFNVKCTQFHVSYADKEKRFDLFWSLTVKVQSQFWLGDMTSAENSISEPLNLKICWGGYLSVPPTKFVPSPLANKPPPPFHPRYKKPIYGPVLMNKLVLSLQQTERLNLTNKSISFMDIMDRS